MDYSAPDGTTVRDYIHIADLCDAHLKAMQYLENNEGSFKFNLGSAKGYSVQEIISECKNISQKKI